MYFLNDQFNIFTSSRKSILPSAVKAKTIFFWSNEIWQSTNFISRFKFFAHSRQYFKYSNFFSLILFNLSKSEEDALRKIKSTVSVPCAAAASASRAESFNDNEAS